VNAAGDPVNPIPAAPAAATARPRKVHAGLWLGGAAVVLVGLPVGVWLGRAALAEIAVRQFCASKGLTCVVGVDRLGLTEVQVSGVSVGPRGQDAPFRARTAAVDLAWEGLTPRVQAVRLDGGALAVRIAEGEDGQLSIDLGGLEALRPERPSTEPMAPFDVEVTDTELVLDTPAGRVAGVATVTGRWPEQLAVTAQLTPTSLARGDAKLTLRQADLSIDRLGLSGIAGVKLTLDLPEAQLGGLAAAGLKLTLDSEGVNLLPGILGQGQGTVVAGELRYARLSYAAGAGETALAVDSVDGVAEIVVETTALRLADDPLDLLAGLSVALSAGPSRMGLGARTVATEGAEADLTLARGEAEGAPIGTLGGPVKLNAQGIETTEGRVAALDLTGAVQITDRAAQPDAKVTLRDVRFEGQARLSRVALNPGVTAGLQAVSGMLPREVSLRGLVQQSVRGLIEAGQRFNLNVPFRVGLSVNRGGETPGISDLVVVVPGGVRLDAANGMVMRLRAARDDLIVLRGGRVSLRPQVDVSGAGLPDMTADFNLTVDPPTEVAPGAATAESTPKPTISGGGQITFRNWEHEGTRLSGQLQGISFRRDASGLTAEGDLTAETDMRYADWALQGARLTGGLRFVQPRDASTPPRIEPRVVGGCLSVAARRITGEAVRLDGLSTRACATGSRWASLGRQVDVAALTVPTLQTDVRLGGDALRARLSLRGGRYGPDGASVEDLRLDSSLAEQPVSLEVSGATANTVRPGSYALAAPRVTLSGAGAPVLAELTGLKGELGLERGSVAMPALSFAGEVRDNPPPIAGRPGLNRFEPVTLTGSVSLLDEVFGWEAAASLGRGRVALGTLTGEHAFGTKAGFAQFDGNSVQFQRGGFQPTMISNLLRGWFTSATGRFAPTVRLAWAPGAKLASSGTLRLEDLSFSTARVGRVDGVTGEITLTDLLDPATPPNQRVVVRQVNPGIPLVGGQLSFQLLPGRRVALSDVRFPFLGGELVLAPSVFTPGGEREHLTLTASGLRGADLAALIKLPGLGLTGTFSGSFPIVLTRTGVLIENAWLEADAVGGNLQFRGPAAEALANNDPGSQIAFRALDNLTYKVLRLGINGDIADNITLSLTLEGHNPAVYGGQPVRMNVAVTSPLTALINSAQLTLSGEAAYREALRRLNDGAPNGVAPGGVGGQP